MAISKNPFLRSFRGRINETIVVKQYKNKTVLTAFPDMTKVKFSEAQLFEQSRMRQAAAFASAIVKDPEKKAAYAATIQAGSSVYHAAIAEFLRKPVKESDGLIITPPSVILRPKT